MIFAQYTFGTSFTSREEQGELVTLSGAYLKDPDDPFVCQILCEDDKYWVSSSRVSSSRPILSTAP